MAPELLAINGGKPVLDLGPLNWPHTTDAIRISISAALDEGSWGQYEGRWTDALLEKLTSKFSMQSALLCPSGTIAVELALRGAGVQPGDEVIIGGYDFPGNFRAIEAIGATPVLVDVVKNGWVIDASQIESALSETTSAIIVSHLHGQTADIDSIRSITDLAEKEIVILEDACQVPGGKSSERPLGSLGDVSVLSFGGSKLLSSGRGGAILTNDDSIFQRAKIYAHRGNDAFPLSQLQALVLVPQIDSLPEMTARRVAGAQQVMTQTESIDSLIPLQQFVSATTPAFYKIPWILNDSPSGWSRTEFLNALKSEGVPVGDGFRGFLRRSPRRCRKIGTLVNCQIAAQQTILLHHPVLLESESTIDLVVEAFQKVASAR